jgi:hypothetical protein
MILLNIDKQKQQIHRIYSFLHTLHFNEVKIVHLIFILGKNKMDPNAHSGGFSCLRWYEVGSKLDQIWTQII